MDQKRWRKDKRWTGLMSMAQGALGWSYGTQGKTLIRVELVYYPAENTNLWNIRFAKTTGGMATLKQKFREVDEAKKYAVTWYKERGHTL